jgi:CRP-like cAMP-binding protein
MTMRSPNHFVAALSPEDHHALAPAMETVTLKRDELITEAGRPAAAAYLPIDSILSIITVMQNGEQVESRTIGRESGYGLLHALGPRRSHERMICQVPGQAIRIPLADLTRAAMARPSLVRTLACHAEVTMIQTAQTVACNALHASLPRLARWLLMTQDRLGSDVVPLTQEHLSIMLGVQRTTITALAQELQADDLIVYSRGKITVRDRLGLLERSCECYADVQAGIEAIFRADGED